MCFVQHDAEHAEQQHAESGPEVGAVDRTEERPHVHADGARPRLALVVAPQPCRDAGLDGEQHDRTEHEERHDRREHLGGRQQ